ncbi:MAG: hypothetical protein AAF530_03150 [Pseudomonadota bacterium]
MSSYRYPVRSLMGDYLRAAMGLGVGLTALLSLPASWVTGVIFGSLTAIFLIFGLRTAYRHHLTVSLDERGVICGNPHFAILSREKSLAWSALSEFRLRYFGNRRLSRSRAKGFYQLSLKGGGVSMMFDSHLEDFDELVRLCFHVARHHGLPLDSATAANLISLGIDATETVAREDQSDEAVSDFHALPTTPSGLKVP